MNTLEFYTKCGKVVVLSAAAVLVAQKLSPIICSGCKKQEEVPETHQEQTMRVNLQGSNMYVSSVTGSAYAVGLLPSKDENSQI